LGKAYTYLRMVRVFSLAFVLGLQPVIAQFCGVQSSCSSCLSLVGCIWNLNACWSSSTFTTCIGPDCISAQGLCPLLNSPVVYPQPYFSGSGSLSATLPPISLPPISLPPVSGFVSAALPPVYSSSVVTTPYPLVSDASYTAAPDFSGIAPVVSSSVLPTVSTSVLPTVDTTSILPAATVVAAPAVTASVATPILGTPVVDTSLAAPVVASAVIPPVAVSGGFYAGGGVGGGGGGGQLFDANGQPVVNTIRNNLYANALSPIIPGIGPIVNTANDVNLLRNSPQFVGNVLNGNGYRRNPVGSFVRNGFYANALGGILGGNVGSSLNTFNQLDLEASLLG